MGNKCKSWSKAEMLELIACKRKKLSNVKTWDVCLAKGIDCTCEDMVQQWKDMLIQFRVVHAWEMNPSRTISFFDMDKRTRSDNDLPKRMDKAVYHELVRFQSDVYRPSRQYKYPARRRGRPSKAAEEEDDSDSGTEPTKSDVQQVAEGRLKLALGKRSLCTLNEAVEEADRTSAKSRKLRVSSSATGEVEPDDGQKVVKEAEDDVTGAIDEVELPSLSSQLVADLELVDKQEPEIEKAVDSKPWTADDLKPWTADDSQALVIFKIEEPMPSSEVNQLLFQDIDYFTLPEPLTVAEEEFDADAFADGFLTLQEEEAKPSTSKTPERLPPSSSNFCWRTRRRLEIEQQKSELLIRANLTFVMAMSQLTAAVNHLSEKLC